MSRKMLLAALLSATIALSPVAANAEHQGPGGGNKANWEQKKEEFRQKMKAELGLTDAQMEKMKSIKEGSKTQGKALHDKLKEKRQAMMDYMKSPNARESQALTYSREVNGIQNQLSELRIKTMFQLKDVLTPEQFQKMLEKKEQFKQRRGGGGGKHRGGGGRFNGGGSSGGGPGGPDSYNPFLEEDPGNF